MSESLNIAGNLLTSSPYTVYQAGILGWLISGDHTCAMFTLCAIVFGDGFNALEKLAARKLMGSGSKIGRRPSGCGRPLESNIPCKGCGIYPRSDGGQSHTFGFPSGHSQILTLAATFWTIYLVLKLNEKSQNKAFSVTAIVILWVLAIGIMIQRVYSRCHSVLQVVVGSLIGAGFGVLSYYLTSLAVSGTPTFGNLKRQKKRP